MTSSRWNALPRSICLSVCLSVCLCLCLSLSLSLSLSDGPCFSVSACLKGNSEYFQYERHDDFNSCGARHGWTDLSAGLYGRLVLEAALFFTVFLSPSVVVLLCSALSFSQSHYKCWISTYGEIVRIRWESSLRFSTPVLSNYLSVYSLIYLFIYLSVCSLSLSPSLRPAISPSISLSVSRPVRFVSLRIFIYLFFLIRLVFFLYFFFSFFLFFPEYFSSFHVLLFLLLFRNDTMGVWACRKLENWAAFRYWKTGRKILFFFF